MKFTTKCKMILSVAVMALTLLLSDSVAEAALVSKKADAEKYTVSVGKTISIDYAKNLKINKKKTSKSKKKVKTVQTANYPSYTSYTKGSYFTASSAYATSDERSKTKANNTKIISTGEYELKFLKAGTYKITYDTYSTQSLSMSYAEWDSANQRDLYQLSIDGETTNERYTYESFDNGDRTYYYYKSTSSGKIYAYASYYDDDDDDYYYYGLVAATKTKGADGKEHLKYSYPNKVKTTHTETYKVMATTSPVASVTLGKSKQTTKRTSNGYKTTTKSTSKKFLSGNSGKLTIKMSSKNYKLNSIIVETYDKDGNVKYTSVKNKSKIDYGLYKSAYTYQSSYSSYSYSYASMYKPTIIHIGYTDKHTGAYSKYEVVTEDGVQYIKSTYKYAGSDYKEETYTSSSYFYGPCEEEYTFYKK